MRVETDIGFAGRRGLLAVVLVVAVAVVTASCATTVPLDTAFRTAVLTPAEPDTNGLVVSGGDVILTAPAANATRGIRFAFWKAAATPSADQLSCATWGPSSAFRQEGAALRMSLDDAGVVRGITITKNVWGAQFWLFNVHTWAAPEATKLVSIDLGAGLNPHGQLQPFPWRFCARAVGDEVSFLVWPTAMAQPAWDDERFGATVRLPPEAPTAGIPGWYMGHLEEGMSVTFTDLTAGSL